MKTLSRPYEIRMRNAINLYENLRRHLADVRPEEGLCEDPTKTLKDLRIRTVGNFDESLRRHSTAVRPFKGILKRKLKTKFDKSFKSYLSERPL